MYCSGRRDGVLPNERNGAHRAIGRVIIGLVPRDLLSSETAYSTALLDNGHSDTAMGLRKWIILARGS